MARMNAKGRRTSEAKHVRQYEWMLASPAYRSLSPHARCLLVELGRRHNGDNNGDIPLSIREAAELLRCHKDTASKAFRDLEDRGFIKPHVKGAFNLKARHSTTWILTEYGFDGERPTKEFMKWKPGPKKQKPVRLNRTDGAIKPDRVRLNRTEELPHGPNRPDRQGQNGQSTVLPDRPLSNIPRSDGEPAQHDQSLSKAQRRWRQDFNDRLQGTDAYGPALDALTPEIQNAATEAEMAKAGSGLLTALTLIEARQ